MGKNSKLNKNNIQDTLTNEKIRKRIENTGFLENTTKIEDKRHKLEKTKNKTELISIKFRV
jgi:hypothetical protein